ncbi:MULTISPECIES: hypothetical protein [Pediococcus]|uniref:Immunity protein n=2 Tax=Pediococcus TaxID=1253 RepID=A0A0R2IPA6_9LACO|nr:MULTISPECIES: hypothetical protein [Pediococcus]KRN67011.1 hypothetical protein IV80_GL001101 [Pediococcus cellicola]KRN83290.1 hypothetical protein IV87_GL001324 [Pediococcus ethanolidurans]SER29825.1 hypothetical protein SAMN04487973_10451 [Pediococcus ethanolidurans]GEL15056.1 hypothetical protein PCE01_08580 [Pediococcus cellicola]GEN94573.1 hypothetical protein PET01_06230 [Pediococcus ethanolidurans]
MNSENVMGLIFILLAIWQFNAFGKAFKEFRKHANRSTTVFSIYGFWSGLLYALIFLGFGIALMFNELTALLSGL